MENTLDQKVDRIEKAVEKNTQSIDVLVKNVAENTQSIDVLVKSVAQNTQSIDVLAKSVAQNTLGIEQNSKDIADLVKIVVAIKTEVEDIKDIMATKTALAEVREQVTGKAEGVQRGLDAQFERHSGLEARVSKIEVELHPEVA